MAGPQDWSRLQCHCGSIYFLQRIHLINRQGGGTTTEQAGYVCRQCNGDIDIGQLIKRLDVERKKAELKALQAEVGTDPEPATSGPPRKG